MRRTLSRIATQLDHLPATWGLGLGAIGASALVGPWALSGEALPAWIAGGGCLGVVWLLAATARPVAKLEPLSITPEFPLAVRRARRPAIPPLVEPLKMIELPGGKFLMGSSASEAGRYENEGPQHEVVLSAFAIAEVPTTQELYRTIMGPYPGEYEGEDLPVNNVSFYDAVRFCNELSKNFGLTPCYTIKDNAVEWDRKANGYRLPTEAEWEYAARAGTTTRYSFGDDDAALGDHGWFRSNASGIEPVGKKRPNPWGLYDVHGNVWEWCWDEYGPYTEAAQRDPVGQAASPGSPRVLRGGSWYDVPRYLRSAFRVRYVPVGRGRDFGFRCVLGSRRQSED